MTPLLLADDLSGALEAGSAFNVRGWRVLLPLTDDAAAEERAPAELRLVNTDSRNLEPDEAAARVRRALRNADEHTLLIKKIDSTLRGPVAAELQELINVLAPALVVLTPANPAAGRTVINGQLLVSGRPVAETEFGVDPLWPAREGHVLRLLTAGGIEDVHALLLQDIRRGPGHVSDVIERARRGGTRVVVSDAESATDLATLVTAARAAERGTVFVGSGALAQALARALPLAGEPTPPDESPSTEGGFVFICGSKHRLSHEQMAYLANESGIPMHRVVLGASEADGIAREVAADLSRRQFAGVVFGTGSVATAQMARGLNACVGLVVGAVERLCRPAGWFATGGDTAMVLCRALGGDRLELGPEIEPGTVAARLRCLHGERWLVTKPGGFGRKETLKAVHAWWNEQHTMK